MVIPLSPKKPCPKILYPEPVLVIAPTLEPSAATTGTNPRPDKRSFSAGGGIRPELGGPPLVRLNSMMTPLSAWLSSLLVPKCLAPLTGRR